MKKKKLKAKTVNQFKILEFIKKNFDINNIEVYFDEIETASVTDRGSEKLYFWVNDVGNIEWCDFPF